MDGRRLGLEARSIGGGEVEIVRLEEWPVELRGGAHEALAMAEASGQERLAAVLAADGLLMGETTVARRGDQCLVHARRTAPLTAEARRALDAIPGCRRFECRPVYFPQTGAPLFSSSAEMMDMARSRRLSLGQLALEYEAKLLDLPETEVAGEMARRFRIMRDAAERGLDPAMTGMQLLEPSAGTMMRACLAGGPRGRRDACPGRRQGRWP